MADFHHGGGGGGSSDAHHNKKRKQGGGGGSGGGGGGNNGFKSLGLSEPVYRGIVRMGFRVSHQLLLYYHLPKRGAKRKSS